MITPATLRSAFPEFANVTRYPDTMIAFWIGVAVVLLPTSTWGEGSTPPANPPTTLYDIGAYLYVAHMITQEAQAVDAAAKGGNPGTIGKGPVTSEGVGGVSRSYDASAGILENGGNWNLTNYGVRFLQLARLAGKGPMQIGVSCGAPNYPWFGPPVFPNGYW